MDKIEDCSQHANNLGHRFWVVDCLPCPVQDKTRTKNI